MDRSSYFSHVIMMLDTFTWLARYICVITVIGNAIAAIPRSKQNSEMGYCTSNLFEYNMKVLFTEVSLGCALNSALVMTCVKVKLIVRNREVADGRMSIQTAVTSGISRMVFFAHVVSITGFASAVLTVFYGIQVRSRKLSCMGTGSQFALVGFLGVVAILLLRESYRLYPRVFS